MRRVDAGRVALQDLLDQAHRFDELRQSSVAQSRRLVMALATETCATACR